MHAVSAGIVSGGWAIDEKTMLEVTCGDVRVHGLGGAYHVRRGGATLGVEVVSGRPHE